MPGLFSCEQRLAEALGDGVPVDELPVCLEVVRAAVAVIDVVRMFPDIGGQQRDVGGRQRRCRGGRIDDVEATVRFLDEPSPAGTEIAGRGSVERLLEFVERAPLRVDCIEQLARAYGLRRLGSA